MLGVKLNTAVLKLNAALETEEDNFLIIKIYRNNTYKQKCIDSSLLACLRGSDETAFQRKYLVILLCQ